MEQYSNGEMEMLGPEFRSKLMTIEDAEKRAGVENLGPLMGVPKIHRECGGAMWSGKRTGDERLVYWCTECGGNEDYDLMWCPQCSNEIQWEEDEEHSTHLQKDKETGKYFIKCPGKPEKKNPDEIK